jgi:hypothetical protein
MFAAPLDRVEFLPEPIGILPGNALERGDDGGRSKEGQADTGKAGL